MRCLHYASNGNCTSLILDRVDLFRNQSGDHGYATAKTEAVPQAMSQILEQSETSGRVLSEIAELPEHPADTRPPVPNLAQQESTSPSDQELCGSVDTSPPVSSVCG
jgi:hypothetical protein